ncbi:MAG: prephenate dehydrogenase [Oscillospiraceae bacterium]|nr:prephenate dehydrogenase [Oscillospiraceae bacterium]
MIIAVVGLGLIGGSLCKAVKRSTDYTVLGLDTNENTLSAAVNDGVVDRGITIDELAVADITFVCLYPRQTIEFIGNNAGRFGRGKAVVDVCGIKSAIIDRTEALLIAEGVNLVPAHPMAGREFSGYASSVPDLFDGASFIITPTKNTDRAAVRLVSDFAKDIGFGKVVVTSAETHDRIIAYTSQLAHIVSNAYIKNPTVAEESGFSAGSYQDLTRVAHLNADMWTPLFMMNREALMPHIDNLIRNLQQYYNALTEGDEEKLKAILE